MTFCQLMKCSCSKINKMKAFIVLKRKYKKWQKVKNSKKWEKLFKLKRLLSC